MNKLKEGPTLIGIAGPSCSGKSTLAGALAKRLDGAAIVSTDSYYRDLSALTLSQRKDWNFDHPDAIDADLLARDIGMLSAGKSVQCPIYDFATHTRVPNQRFPLEPCKYIIVEGLFVLYWRALREQFQQKIFVEAPQERCFDRRKLRDVQERARDLQSVVTQYETTVLKMGEQFVLPTKQFANLIIDGEAPLDKSVRAIVQRLQGH